MRSALAAALARQGLGERRRGWLVGFAWWVTDGLRGARGSWSCKAIPRCGSRLGRSICNRPRTGMEHAAQRLVRCTRGRRKDCVHGARLRPWRRVVPGWRRPYGSRGARVSRDSGVLFPGNGSRRFGAWIRLAAAERREHRSLYDTLPRNAMGRCWLPPSGRCAPIYNARDGRRRDPSTSGYIQMRRAFAMRRASRDGWPLMRTGRISRCSRRRTQKRRLRHELLPACWRCGIANAAPGLPLWFREGLVEYLSGAVAAPGAARIPSDSDLRQTQDAARARHAYGEAAAAVAELAMRYGETALLRWVKSGIPSSASRPPAKSK